MTKIVLITGSTDGIGLETAKLLAADGHRVLLQGRTMVHEENIVLRAAGAELLSPRAPAGLPVIG